MLSNKLYSVLQGVSKNHSSPPYMTLGAYMTSLQGVGDGCVSRVGARSIQQRRQCGGVSDGAGGGDACSEAKRREGGVEGGPLQLR